MITVNEFFSGQDEPRTIFDFVLTALYSIGPVQIQVTKSQIVFIRKKAFAWVVGAGEIPAR